MVKNLVSNPCIRCGKGRITTSSYEEYIGKSKVIVTSTVCPDSSCQAKVDRQLEKEQARREEIRNSLEKRKFGWEAKQALKIQVKTIVH